MTKNQLIITGNYNKLKIDRTKWYRIDYEKLSIILPFTQNEQMQSDNLGRPIPENNLSEKISKKVIMVAPAEPTEKISSFSFDEIPKKDNIFRRATEAYGEERCKQALSIIDNFVDEHYPNYTGKEHGKLNKAQRMAFAVKILECEDETEIYISNFEPMFKFMLHNYDKKKL